MAENQKLLTVADFNKKVLDWSVDVKQQAGIIIAARTSSSGRLKQKLTNKVRQDKDGVSQAVGYLFEKYGVFLQYGVGRGYVRVGNRVVRGTRVTNFPELVAQYRKKGERDKDIKKMKIAFDGGAVKRVPVDWLDGILAQRISSLADIAGEFYGDKSLRHVLDQLNKITIKKK
mgnify:CR=1 FL=1